MRTGTIRKRLDWSWRIRTSGIRALPDFIIVGAAKCGTTSLYKFLAQHPQVRPAERKEVNYFDINYHRGLGWYQSHFPPRVVMRLCSSGTGRAVTGEASPYYLFHPHAARRIAADLPDVKLIALLRDPVERAYSHYKFNVRRGLESRSFEDALAWEIDHMEEEKARVVTDETYQSRFFRLGSYLHRGFYVEQLERYGEFLRKGSMLVLASEDLFRDSESACRKVLQFLGLHESRALLKAYNVGVYDRDHIPDEKRLRALFAPKNHALVCFLGRNLPWR